MRLLRKHHYLGDLQPVGEQVLYVAVSPNGGWRGLLVFCAAAKHLRHREQWIGWSNEQRRRLGLVVNNARFLILPRYHVPNLATRILRLTCQRLSADWQQRYGHPLAVVEGFVDPEQFQGTIYKAAGWQELGLTDGCGRVGRDYYVRHNRPKRLFVRELCARARRGLQAEHLKPAWAAVEAKSIPRCMLKTRELRSLVEHVKDVAEYRSRTPTHPVWGLLAITALAYLCGAPRGQKALVKFARQLNQGIVLQVGARARRRLHVDRQRQPERLKKNDPLAPGRRSGGVFPLGHRHPLKRGARNTTAAAMSADRFIRARPRPNRSDSLMWRRLHNSTDSLFAEWRSRDPKRRWATLTDFHAAMGEEDGRCAVRFLFAKRPAFKERS